MKEWFYLLKDYVQNIHPLLIYIILFTLGLYVFWRGCSESRRNRSSIFDIFIISSFLSLLIGRVVYIILEWSAFSSYMWYWLPYEKYGDEIYLFRLLPWRFFRIWDGGLIILAVFVSLILFLTFFSLVVKKWRWKHVFLPIYFSSTTMLGFSFIYLNFISGFNQWIYRGLFLVSILVIFSLIYKFIYKIVKDPLREKYLLGYIGVSVVILSSVYIGYLYMSTDLSLLENILVGIFLIWSLVMSFFFISDLKKARVKIQNVSTVRSVKIN